MYNSTLEVFVVVKIAEQSNHGTPTTLWLSAHKVTPKKHSFQWDVRSAQAMVFRKVRHSLILVHLTVASGVVAFIIRAHAA